MEHLVGVLYWEYLTVKETILLLVILSPTFDFFSCLSFLAPNLRSIQGNE